MKIKLAKMVLFVIVAMCLQAIAMSVSLDSADKQAVSHWQNSLAPKGDCCFDLNLAKEGKAGFKILLPDNASTVEVKAADMLKQALEAGTGCVFSIICERDRIDQSAVLSVGQTNLYRKSGLKHSIDLEEDGYSIAEKDGTLFLTGGSRRGAISAAIALIEEDLGGRFYCIQDGLQMPKLSAVEHIVLREYLPQFKVRTMFQSESFDKDYQLFNRVGSSTSSYDYVPQNWGGSTCLPKEFFIHTLSTLLPNDTYFDKHPEYFALVDGKRRLQGHGNGGELCLSNPDVRRIVTERVLRELKKYHSYKLFDISANDNHDRSFCQCPNCMAIEEKEGCETGQLLTFVNYIADKVAEVYPDVKITMAAYKKTSQPSKNVRPRDNVIIRLAHTAQLYPYPIVLVEENQEFCEKFKKWKGLGSQLFIWEYAVSFLAWPMPRPNLEVIGRNIDFYAKEGIYGLFIQSSHYGPGENQGRLRAWVYSKKMWDPSRNMKDLIRDFNYGYFGKAADLMQSYNDLLDEQWHYFHDKVDHKLRDAFVFREDYYPRARAIFDKALKLVADDPALLAKVEFEFVSPLFYRLEMMPPKDDKDKQLYKKDLELFEKLTKRYNVKWISESKTKTVQRLQEWRYKYDIKSDNIEETKTISLKTDDVTLYDNGAEKIKDPLSPDGKCLRLPVLSEVRSLEWFFGSALLKDTKYSVRVLVRADKKKSKGAAVDYGIRVRNLTQLRHGEELEPLKGTIDASDMSDAEYKWVDCGQVNGSDTPSSYFYFAQISDSSVRYIYVAEIQFVPQIQEK